MGLRISPFLCDYYLLFWELKQCKAISRQIRHDVPGAISFLPNLLSTLRYLDDILHIFPLDHPGVEGLKISRGGPYPDSIGIKTEGRGKAVNFLDATLSQRRGRKIIKNHQKEPAFLTWTLFDKRRSPKFSKLSLRRGVHHSTALDLSYQLLPILSEGIRFSRKCSRIKPFIKHFSSFLIDQIGEHNCQDSCREIYRLVRKAIYTTSIEHVHLWKLTDQELWTRLLSKIHGRLVGYPYEPHIIRRVRMFLKNIQSLPNPFWNKEHAYKSIKSKRRLKIDSEPIIKKRRLNNDVPPVINSVNTDQKIPDSTDIGSVPVPLADLLVPKIDSQYIDHDTLEDTDSKMSELPKSQWSRLSLVRVGI